MGTYTRPSLGGRSFVGKNWRCVDKEAYRAFLRVMTLMFPESLQLLGNEDFSGHMREGVIMLLYCFTGGSTAKQCSARVPHSAYGHMRLKY